MGALPAFGMWIERKGHEELAHRASALFSFSVNTLSAVILIALHP